MTEELANLVFPTIRYGLRLQERLERGAKPRPDLDEEQSRLRQLLKSAEEARHWPNYGRDGPFLGGHFALVCWLDEIFIFNSPWGPQWKNRPLEYAFYTTAEGAALFWEQADLAWGRPDALEVFYLCVMLGFRGRYRDQPAELGAWRKRAEEQIRKNRPGKWDSPEEMAPASDVPPLRARDRLRRVFLVIALVLGLVIPVAAFVVVAGIGNN